MSAPVLCLSLLQGDKERWTWEVLQLGDVLARQNNEESVIWHILDKAPSQRLQLAIQPAVTVARLQCQKKLRGHQLITGLLHIFRSENL